MERWLDKYENGGNMNEEPDFQFGNLHINSSFIPSRINLGKSEAVSGMYKVPGKVGFGTLPFLDLLLGAAQMINEEKEIEKSDNPEYQRKFNHYQNLDRANQLTPIQKEEYEFMNRVYKNGGNLQEHQENYNEEFVRIPPNFVGQGYDTSGRNYSPAWGGQFEGGGSIPGTVGFSYARTGSTPSEGPRAKKTLPSAEDGMTFYQNGMDWQPKMISKEGITIQDLGQHRKLDQLINFTNYNKPEPGGWLDKYK